MLNRTENFLHLNVGVRFIIEKTKTLSQGTFISVNIDTAYAWLAYRQKISS
jgi:hypothetical protein